MKSFYKKIKLVSHSFFWPSLFNIFRVTIYLVLLTLVITFTTVVRHAIQWSACIVSSDITWVDKTVDTRFSWLAYELTTTSWCSMAHGKYHQCCKKMFCKFETVLESAVPGKSSGKYGYN